MIWFNFGSFQVGSFLYFFIIFSRNWQISEEISSSLKVSMKRAAGPEIKSFEFFGIIVYGTNVILEKRHHIIYINVTNNLNFQGTLRPRHCRSRYCRFTLPSGKSSNFFPKKLRFFGPTFGKTCKKNKKKPNIRT